jgi:TolB-like protein
MLYAAAFIAVTVVAKAAVVGIGLPTWVLPGTVVVMALGLPVILFTAFVHHGAHEAMTMAQLTPGGSPVAHSTMTRLAVKASPWVNWRRTTVGGAVALGVFIVLVAGYMVTRALGIGPAASLMGAGVLGSRERLLITDFKSPPADTSLGPVVTETFRTDLMQSASLDIVQPTTVRDVLRRMQRPPDARVDFALAREVATREGVKAVVDGEVLALGGSYVIAAKLVSAQSGEVLASFRETANDSKDIIAAIDHLSRDVRTKVGESLKSINAAPPLEQVTTPSLAALKKYVQGVQVFREGGDFRPRAFAAGRSHRARYELRHGVSQAGHRAPQSRRVSRRRDRRGHEGVRPPRPSQRAGTLSDRRIVLGVRSQSRHPQRDRRVRGAARDAADQHDGAQQRLTLLQRPRTV